MTQTARILIISSGNPANNPRPVKEAETLGRAGFAVTLLTPFGNPRSIPLDRALTSNAPFRHVRLAPPTKIVDRCIRWILHRAAWTGFESPRLLGPTTSLFHAALAEEADLTIVHNEAPHWVGTQLIGRGRLVAADIEDWHSEDLLPEERKGRPVRMLRKIEGALLASAAYTSTTSQSLAEALHARYGGKKPEVITNSFPLQPSPPPRDQVQPPKFFWFSQTIGPGRGLEVFLAAWSRTTEPSSVVLLGNLRAGYEQALLSEVPSVVRSRIQFLPAVSPQDLPAVIASHDVGLALEDATIVNRDLTITNKILQYLNAGLAVVATDTKGQREVLAHDSDAGIVISSTEPGAYAQQLDALLADRAALARRQHVARRLAETRYSWEHEAPRLINLVTQALATRGTSAH